MNDLLYIKELAAKLRKSRTYVHAMKKSGFKMPGGTATIEEARNWLKKNPGFACTDYAKNSKNPQKNVKSS
jgi:hypothetical protein